MYKGSCLCKKITFEIMAEPLRVSHCHCQMCQKQHGSAFATYATFPRNKITYLYGEQSLSVYNSSNDIQRKFCKYCGSNVEWLRSKDAPNDVGIAIGLFDNEFKAQVIKHLFIESKVCWEPK